MAAFGLIAQFGRFCKILGITIDGKFAVLLRKGAYCTVDENLAFISGTDP